MLKRRAERGSGVFRSTFQINDSVANSSSYSQASVQQNSNSQIAAHGEQVNQRSPRENPAQVTPQHHPVKMKPAMPTYFPARYPPKASFSIPQVLMPENGETSRQRVGWFMTGSGYVPVWLNPIMPAGIKQHATEFTLFRTR